MIAGLNELNHYSPDDLATALFIVFQECWSLMDDDQREEFNPRLAEQAARIEQGSPVYAPDLQKDDASVAAILRLLAEQ